MLHTNDKIVKHKVGLLNLADELGNISKACKMMVSVRALEVDRPTPVMRQLRIFVTVNTDFYEA